VDEQQSWAGAGTKIPHARTVRPTVEGYPVLFDGEFVLRMNVRGECAVHGDFLVVMRQLFISCRLLCKSIASVALKKGEFRLSLIFCGAYESRYKHPNDDVFTLKLRIYIPQ